MKHNDTIESIMKTEYPVLTDTMTLEESIDALLENKVLAMPVVDQVGKYIGQFRKNILIAAVLPQVAVHDPRFDRIARTIERGSLEETLKDVRERFSAIAKNPVRRYLDTDTPELRPDQPIICSIFYLFHGRNFLPVVEPDSGLLVGVISAWDILRSIEDKE